MLNISGIHEGFVLDHIQAGMSLQIYHDLKLDKLDCSVAIIKNAKVIKWARKILSKWSVRLKHWIWIFSVLSIIILR